MMPKAVGGCNGNNLGGSDPVRVADDRRTGVASGLPLALAGWSRDTRGMTTERQSSGQTGRHSWRGAAIVAGAAIGSWCGLLVGLYMESGIVAFGGSISGLVLGVIAGAVGERAVMLASRRGTGQAQADYDDDPPAAP